MLPLLGRLAQLGERYPYKVDVGSSILSSPTNSNFVVSATIVLRFKFWLKSQDRRRPMAPYEGLCGFFLYFENIGRDGASRTYLSQDSQGVVPYPFKMLRKSRSGAGGDSACEKGV